jgi:hypothetical protein
MAIAPQSLVFLALIPLILWRMYSRIRRMVGRQASSPRRQWLTVCLFPLLAVLLGSVSASQPFALLALAGGIVLGALLGVVGHRLTKFEQTAEGLFYTPSAHLGIALSLLFAGRVLYRFVNSGLLAGHAGGAPANSPPGPLTLAVFGMLAGYYVSYAIGLILWRRNAARNGLQAAAKLEQRQ